MRVPDGLVLSFRVILSLVLGLVGLAFMASGVGFYISLGFFGVAALLVAHPIANAIAGAFVGNGLGNQAPEIPQLSRVRALIAQRDFATARSELTEILTEQPDLIVARVLLLRLLYDHLHDAEGALVVAQAELADAHWRPEEEQIAGLAVDILLDLGRRAEAIALLQRVLPKARGSAAEATLRQRLHALSEPGG